MSPRITYSTRCVAVLCIAVLCIFLVAPIASASPSDSIPFEGEGLIVDCEFTDCHFGDIFELANRVIKVLIWLAVTGIALVIIWHGAILAMNAFFDGEYQGKVKDAQKAIRMALFGLVLALSAYLIVDFFFRQLGYIKVDDIFKAPPAPASISKAPASVTLFSDGGGEPNLAMIPHSTPDTTPTISFIAVSGATTTAEYREGTTGSFTPLTVTGSGADTERSVTLPTLATGNYQVKITQDEDGADGPMVPKSITYRFIIISDSDQDSQQPRNIDPPPGSHEFASTCSQCVSLTDASFTYKTRAQNGCSGNGDCYLNHMLKSRLDALSTNTTLREWRVTESWPPTFTHQNDCHSIGDCADVNFDPNDGDNPAPAADVQAFVEAARANNLRAVYEVKTEEQKQALIDGGVDNGNVSQVTRITNPHFSVYLR